MLWSIFHSSIDELMRKYVPIKEFSERKIAWLNPTFKNMYPIKKKKYRKWESNPTRRNLTQYKNYSRIVKTKIIATKNILRDVNFIKKIISRSSPLTISRGELNLPNQ